MKKIKIQGTDEFIYQDKSLYNMPVYIWEDKNLNGFYLSLCVKYGSIHTKFKCNNKTYSVPKGIAHYLEHIKFNESDNLKANDYFDKLGSDINAFTTYEYTNYEVTGHDYFKENLSHLISYVLNPYFTENIINKERGIITEEIKMDKDNPYSKLFYKSLENAFQKSNYRNLVAGEVKDIKEIDLNAIKAIYETFYHPENMFLVICGNVDKNKSMKIINDTLSNIKISSYKKPTVIAPKEPLKVTKKENIYKDNVMIPKAKLIIKIPISKFKNYDKEKLLIYSRIVVDANFGNTSDFKENLLEKNLVNSFSAYRNIFDENYLLLTFTYESESYKEVKKIILDKLKKLDIEPSYLKRIIKCNIANMILGFESKEVVSGLIQNDIIEYNEIKPNTRQIYNDIDINELNKLAKLFNYDNISTTVVIPKQ